MTKQLTAGMTFAIAIAMGIGHAQEVTDDSPAQISVLPIAQDDYTPQTRSERLKTYVDSTFGPKAVASSFAHGALDQVRNQPKEWTGSSGLGARVGSDFAHHIIRGTIEHGAAAVLHEDNRYHRADRRGVWPRARHAIVSTFVARHDNGRRGFAISRIGSAGGAAFLGHAWLPATAASAGSTFGLTIAADIGANLFREFWPDLKKHFGRK